MIGHASYSFVSLRQWCNFQFLTYQGNNKTCYWKVANIYCLWTSRYLRNISRISWLLWFVMFDKFWGIGR